MIAEDITKKRTCTMQEAAALLGVSYTTVQRLVNSGKLGTLPGMRRRLIPLAELDRYLESASEKGGNQ